MQSAGRVKMIDILSSFNKITVHFAKHRTLSALLHHDACFGCNGELPKMKMPKSLSPHQHTKRPNVLVHSAWINFQSKLEQDAIIPHMIDIIRKKNRLMRCSARSVKFITYIPSRQSSLSRSLHTLHVYNETYDFDNNFDSLIIAISHQAAMLHATAL